jgi:hypothetical protein
MQTGVKVEETAQFMQIYRSREVGQSYLTSVWTTLIATAHALWMMFKIRPQVVFSFTSFILPYMYVLGTTYIYIDYESNYYIIFCNLLCITSDSLQWAGDLCSTMCNCILFQGVDALH